MSGGEPGSSVTVVRPAGPRPRCGLEPNCIGDEGGPFGPALQEEGPNRRKLLRSKALVVSVTGKRRGVTSSGECSGAE